MSRLRKLTYALPILAIAACNDVQQPMAPEADAGLAFAVGSRSILMLDNCDPETFNQVAPNLCVGRNGGLTFEHFIAQLTKHQTVASWRFSPDNIHVPREMTLPIVNRGGEVHTFTEVEEFGGGLVPDLNLLMGLSTVPPECQALAMSEFIAPGGHTTHTFEPGEDDKYQCCIHPWMRATTR